MSDVYFHPRGADLLIDAQWISVDTETPIDLTGVTLEPFEIEPAGLAASMTMTVTDAAAGRFRIACPWSSAWPDGVGRLVSIRVQPSNGAPLSIKIPVQLT